MDISFRDNLKTIPSQEDEDKKRKIDAYKEFLTEAMPGYIAFMEAMNHTITELELEGIIGKAELKTRVKAINSALINTEEKTLDDIFGFEFITENERDKEILMLIIHNLFVQKYVRQKNHNKSNGYFAHHCTGAVKLQLDGTEGPGLEQHILCAETNELKMQYRDLPKKEQKKLPKTEIFCRKPRYPILRMEIIENGGIDNRLQENFDWALGFIDQYLSEIPSLRRDMPVFEMQFKTRNVAQEAKMGRAQHSKYKKVNEDKIIEAYYGRKLVRGVNFPFTFIRNEEGDLEIEHTSQTLISMWPFMADAVSRYHKIHDCPVANYDMYFAKIFPDLEPYVQRNLTREPSIPVDSSDLSMVWSVLKNKIINDSFVLPDADGILKNKTVRAE